VGSRFAAVCKSIVQQNNFINRNTYYRCKKQQLCAKRTQSSYETNKLNKIFGLTLRIGLHVVKIPVIQEWFKGKVKWTRYAPWRRFGWELVQLLLFLNAGTRRGWVVSFTPRPRFTPGERSPGTHCRGGWLGPRAGLKAEVRGKILCLCQGSNTSHQSDPILTLFVYSSGALTNSSSDTRL
jgi:hypothetical protein